jgi:hypothetical protein
LSLLTNQLTWLADESYFNSLRTTHFLFSGKKRKEKKRKEPLRGKKGKENGS